jgi:hypothetical protein
MDNVERQKRMIDVLVKELSRSDYACPPDTECGPFSDCAACIEDWAERRTP